MGINTSATNRLDLDRQDAGPSRDGCPRTIDLILGEQKLRPFLEEIRELRLRCGQQHDLTTDPEYFITNNTTRFRRVAAVLIRRHQELEACIYLTEHCIMGVGLGLLEGGDGAGEGFVVGAEAFRVEYVHLAAQALLRGWRVHGVSLRMSVCLNDCIEVIAPESRYRVFVGRDTPHKLPLQSTYAGTLADMGPRTRRSLAGKRRLLQEKAHVEFVPFLDPAQAFEAMLSLRARVLPHRFLKFYRARYKLLRERPDFFSMGMRLPDGTWLSLLSGWRSDRVTYIDLQMNDRHFRKESLSAVMRCFMLEHEIGSQQRLVDFVGGTSLLLRRYCRPIEPCTDIFIWQPCLRATLCKMAIPRLKRDSIYKRVEQPTA